MARSTLTRRIGPRAALLLSALLIATTAAAEPEAPIAQAGFETGDCSPRWPVGVVGDWTAIYGSWPNFGNWRALTVGPRTYISLRFTVPESTIQVGSVEAYDRQGTGPVQLSISTVPGCFNPAVVGPACVSALQSLPSLPFEVETSLTGRCRLQRGQTYYINFGGEQEAVRDLVITPA